MSEHKKVKNEIRETLSEAVLFLSKNYAGSSLTDIFLLIDKDSGELSVFDDEENCITKRIIDAWTDLPPKDTECEEDSVYARDLREVITQMDEDDLFAKLNIYTPFSINLADENFIVKEELLLIEDDSLIRIDNEFMERMDKEFDDFLDRLLKE